MTEFTPLHRDDTEHGKIYYLASQVDSHLGLVMGTLESRERNIENILAVSGQRNDEIIALRKIIQDCVAALGTSAGVSVDSTLEFLKNAPVEIRMTVDALRAATVCSDCGGTGEMETGIGMMVCDSCGGH